MTRQFTAIIERENEGFVALCPELDIASQGDTIEGAGANLQEALELFLETASAEEIDQRVKCMLPESRSLSAKLRTVGRIGRQP